MSTAAGRMRAAWLVMTGTGSAASLAFALLVLACVFISVAAPKESLELRTRALQRMFAAQPAEATSLRSDVGYSDFDPALSPVPSDTIARLRSDIRGSLAADRIPLADAGADWASVATGYEPVTGELPRAVASVGPPQLEVVYRDTLGRNARLLAGKRPVIDRVSAFSGPTVVAGHRAVFQVAVTRATAARFGLHVGSQLGWRAGVTLEVTGIVQPSGPGSAFWTTDPNAAAPSLYYPSRDSTPYWQGAVFMGPGELPDLESFATAANMHLTWDFPLALGQVTADQASALVAMLNRAGTLSVPNQRGDLIYAGAASGLLGPLADFTTADAAVGSVLALLLVSLTAVGMVVLLLGAGLLAEQRHDEFALMRARGSALWQIAGRAFRGAVIVVVPAAAVATLIALAAIPGPTEPLSWWLAGLTGLVALAGPPLIAGVRHVATDHQAGRTLDASATRVMTARRLVAEVTLVVAAGAGLIVLKREGTPVAGGINLYTSSAPVLVALPAAMLVMRLYPVTLRLATRLAGMRRGVIVFVGLARGGRTSRTAVLPAFALVLALAVVAFGAIVRDAVQRGQVAASWQRTGADAVVGSPSSSQPLGGQVQQAIAAVPGVEHTAPVVQVSEVTTAGGAQLSVAFVNPARMAAVIAHTPGPPFPAAALARPPGVHSGPVPVLASPAAAAIVGRAATPVSIGLLNTTVRVAKVIANSPAAPEGGAFLVVPLWAAGARQPPPTMMLIAGPHLNRAALDAAVRRSAPDTPVILRSDVLAGLRNAPLPRVGYVAFAEGAAAAAGFSVLILLIMLVLGARSRELTLARLSTMGLSAGRARRLALIEAAPPIVAATIGGLAAGWALVPLVAPSINLSALIGSELSVPVRAHMTTLAATAAGLVALTVLTLLAEAVVARRRGIGRALRVGDLTVLRR